MRKTLSLFLALVMCLSLVACGGKNKEQEITTSNLEQYCQKDISCHVTRDEVVKETRQWAGTTIYQVRVGEGYVLVSFTEKDDLQTDISSIAVKVESLDSDWELVKDENIYLLHPMGDGVWSGRIYLHAESAMSGIPMSLKESDVKVTVESVTGTVKN